MRSEGKRVLVVEDGPTLTHGEMAYGAGWVAARRFGAAEIVDPRPFAVGSIIETYKKYPTTGNVLPAMGYGEKQMKELEQIHRQCRCGPGDRRHTDRSDPDHQDQAALPAGTL